MSVLDPVVVEDGGWETFGRDILAIAPKLRAYATALLGAPGEAEDLVHDAIVRALGARATFQPGSNLEAWTFRILRNEFLAQVHRRRRFVPDVDGQWSGAMAVAPDQEWRVQVLDVLLAVARLPSDQREALLLIAGGGLSHERAAKVCRCSVDAMKQRVHRARQALARHLNASLAERTSGEPSVTRPKADSSALPDSFRQTGEGVRSGRSSQHW